STFETVPTSMTNMAEGEVLGPTGNRGISSVTFGAEVTGSLASHSRCEFPGKVATFPSKMASVHRMWPATVLVGHTDHQVRGVGGDFRRGVGSSRPSHFCSG